MLIVCSNGCPVRIRTAKNMDGAQLRQLGYRHFTPGIRYDICHTKSRRVRMVKTYRYADACCDITFYSNTLQPIADIAPLLHIPKDKAVREVCANSLNRMLNRAIYLVNIRRRPPYFDLIPPPYYEEEDGIIPDFFKRNCYNVEELPF